MNKKHAGYLILASLLIKVLYVIVISLYTKEMGVPQENWLEVFFRNDAGWYKSIVEGGYERITKIEDLGLVTSEYIKQSNWAFFPCYPLSIAFFTKLFGMSFMQGALCVSILASTACFLAFYRFTAFFLKDDSKAYSIALLFIVSPFHYHFSMFYTEAVFLLFLLLSMLGIALRKYWMTVLCAAALVLVRPNGLICLLPLWLYMLEQNGFTLKQINWNSLIKKSLVFVPAVLVFASYLLYQYLQTGYYNAFSLAQAGWMKTTTFPLLSLFKHGGLTNTVNSIYTCIVMVFALFSVKKLPLSMNVFIWLNLLLPLTAGSVISMTRYISVLFPLFILIAAASFKLPKSRYFLYALCLGLQVYLLKYWAISDPMSY
jgi:hypothetical protein